MNEQNKRTDNSTTGITDSAKGFRIMSEKEAQDSTEQIFLRDEKGDS